MGAHRLQFEAQKFSCYHPSQCGGIIGHLTEDAGSLLVNHIQTMKKKGFHSSTLAMDIAQCFPSVNHSFLLCSLEHFGFAPEIISFFWNYLSDRTPSFR